MKNICLILTLVISSFVQAQKPRLIVLTDIGQDPDDEQSMVRLLHYANEFQIEGLIATSDNNYKKEKSTIHDEIIRKMINDYENSWKNFNNHAKGYPTAKQLRKTVKRGNAKGGKSVPIERFIGKEFDTEGSDWIIVVVDQESDQPVCIAVWGGACDLAQALWKIKHTRSDKEVIEFVKKLQVFLVGMQDASNQWIADEFPGLWLVIGNNLGGDNWQSGYRGMFWGGDMSKTSRDWIHTNIHGHSLLANDYPDHTYTGGEGKNPFMAVKEGDTPSFFFFLPNGLNVPKHPEWGGWGGRYNLVKPNSYRDASDTYFDDSIGKEITSPRATVFRWRNDFQNDFAARIDWGANPKYKNANHNPVINLNGKEKRKPLILNVEAGTELNFDATKTSDPDGNKLTFEWSQYNEAGTCPEELNFIANSKGNIKIFTPENAKGTQVHFILKVSDNGTPSLCSYKRIVVNIQ